MAAITPPGSTGEFLELVRGSGILRTGSLEEYLAAIPNLPPDPNHTAQILVRQGILTLFQANQLLVGRHKGFRVGPYIIQDKLGQGGMGAVYLAEHVTLRRRVALKVLPPQKGSDQRVSVERFLREARAAAALDHPNIVRIHDISQHGEMHYLGLEYVEGQTLEQLLRSGPTSPSRAVGFIAQAAAGLQHAHEKGIVHRDIKPSNLILAKDGTVKILDMGLARSFTSTEDHLTEVLEKGAVVGTADYIAPEQALADSKVDIRADIYSLGATFYALVAGKPPFEGSTSQKLIQHQMKPVADLSERDPTFPPKLAHIVRKMMAKKPEERYQTPAEVIAALTPWLSEDGGHKVVVGLSGTSQGNSGKLQETINEIASKRTKRTKVRLPVQRNRIKLIGAAAAALVLVVGLVTYVAWPREKKIETNLVQLASQPVQDTSTTAVPLSPVDEKKQVSQPAPQPALPSQPVQDTSTTAGSLPPVDEKKQVPQPAPQPAAPAENGWKEEALNGFCKALKQAVDRGGKATVIVAAAPRQGMLQELAKRAPDDGLFQAELARYCAEQGDYPLADAARTRARAVFEAQLAKEPEDTAIAGELADLLVAHLTRWTVLKPAEMNAAGGATLTRLEDNSILVSGSNPPQDVYTLTFRDLPARLCHLRLEVLPHESLPHNGPGRFPGHGGFFLTAIKAQLGSPANENTSEARSLRLTRAFADFNQKGYDVNSAIAIDGSGWAIFPETGKRHFALIELAEPLSETNGKVLRVTLELKTHSQHGLGRFRISVCPDAASLGRDGKYLALAASSPQAKLGAAYLGIDEPKLAASFLTRATVANSKPLPADWVALALAEAKLKDTEQVKKACAKAGELLKPNGADATLFPLIRELLLALGTESSEARELIAAAVDGSPPPDWTRMANATSYRARGEWFGTRGRWKEAAAEFAEAYRLERNAVNGMKLGLVLLQNGQMKEYREHSKAVLDDWALTTDVDAADHALKTIIFLKYFEADSKKLARLVEVAVSGDKNAEGYEWKPFGKALFDYRTGKYDDAIAGCRDSRQRALARAGGAGPLTALTLIVEAMALHDQGKLNESQRTLEEARLKLKQHIVGIDAIEWHDWLSAIILYQEAEGLIDGKKDGPQK